jgi:hypothetical protein
MRASFITLINSNYSHMTDFISAYTMPEKYAVELPLNVIVCDEKIDPDYVKHLMVKGSETLVKPIVVVKHPAKQLYAVLDGHHRFWAAKLGGAETIKAAVVDDYDGLLFELTKSGSLQPPPEFTKYIRVPIKLFIESIAEFLKNP